MLPKQVHNQLLMLPVLLLTFTENQDIIQVHQNKLPNVWSKDLIYCCLKGCRSIAQTKTEHFELM